METVGHHAAREMVGMESWPVETSLTGGWLRTADISLLMRAEPDLLVEMHADCGDAWNL